MAILTFGQHAVDMSAPDGSGLPVFADILQDVIDDNVSSVDFQPSYITIATPSGSFTLYGTFNFSSEAALLNSTATGLVIHDSSGALVMQQSGFSLRFSSALNGAGVNPSGNDTITGSVLGDTLQGDAGNDSIRGGTGNDNLQGEAGNDTLDGEAGDNRLYGGLGHDVYRLHAGDDVFELLNQGIDRIEYEGSFSLFSAVNVENLTLLGTGDFIATGDNGANVLTGNSGHNVLEGHGGKDTMVGGLGNDTYGVDMVGETVTEGLNAGIDLVRSTVSYVLGANLEQLLLLGAANLAGTGNALANTITGNDGDNSLNGAGGNDTYVGSGGNDLYVITEAGDAVDGSGGDDGTDTVRVALAGSSYLDLSDKELLENVVFTGVGTATLTGNSISNELTGNASANTLDGGAGSDVMKGLAGNDLYRVDDSGDGIVDSAGVDTVEASATYTLATGLENLTLTGDGDINGTGNAAANVLRGNSGVNVLVGLGGNDTYYVQNAGDTTIEVAGGGIDHVFALLVPEPPTPVGDGLVVVVTGPLDYTLGAEIERLTIGGDADNGGIGNALGNLITGNAGYNWLDGAGGKDTMVGSAGDDTYTVDVAGEVVTELAGGGTGDTVRSYVSWVLGANLENLELLDGELEAANLNGTGNGLDNRIAGNSGNNILNGAGGNDTYVLSGGDDTYWLTEAGDSLEGTHDDGADTLLVKLSSSPYLDLRSWAMIENLAFTGTGSVALRGNSGANVLTGGAGQDTFLGYEGDDTLIGGAGNDLLYGDGGIAPNLSISGGGGIIIVVPSVNYGDDVLTGGAGHDTLDGQNGDDSMAGGAGNDVYYVGSDGDVVDETGGSGVDTVVSRASFTLGAGLEHLTLAGNNYTAGTGNAVANLMQGDNSNNTMSGLAGNDTLRGDFGDDVLSGGAGVDSVAGGDGADIILLAAGDYSTLEFIDGGADIDRIRYTSDVPTTLVLGARVTGIEQVAVMSADGDDSSLAAVNINAAAVASGLDFRGNDGANLFTGTAFNDYMWSQGGNDTLLGGNGNDLLIGNEGNDSLAGGLGNDTLDGMEGTDRFVFNTALGPANVDLLSVESGVDKVVLDDDFFVGIGAVGALNASAFGVYGSADASDRILFDSATGNLYFDGDGSAAAKTAVLFATLVGGITIAAGDFEIVA
jgi:Ca2+-binding RTX toxin-like protein